MKQVFKSLALMTVLAHLVLSAAAQIRADGAVNAPTYVPARLPVTPGGPGSAHIPLPADLTGTLDGTEYLIRVPANWKGTLLVFAHGNQISSLAEAMAPIAIPPANAFLVDRLLDLGYALAGSRFVSTEKEGVLRTVALTNFFKGAVGNPSRIILWGNSQGAGVVLKLIEKYPGIYDGAVANCGAPGAGIPENMDSALAFSLAYAAAFGWHDDLWGPVGDVRDDINFMTDVVPIVMQEANPAQKFGRWEFVRLVQQLPQQAFWGSDPQLSQPFVLLQMWKATARRAAVEAYSGGPVAENIGAHYSLTDDQKAYLSSLGLNADDLLAYMNARTNITASIPARNHATGWGAFTGQLRRPVLTTHAKFDGLSFTSNESYYAELVTAAGCSDQLVQSFLNTAGHCSLTADQYIAGITAMSNWLDTGVRPDETLLPPALKFDLTYTPDPWIF